MENVYLPPNDQKFKVEVTTENPETGQQWTIIGYAAQLELDIDNDYESIYSSPVTYSNKSAILKCYLSAVNNETFRIYTGQSLKLEEASGNEGLDLLRRILSG